jgi:alkanesulfonate monooxygenase SsuD/methylene tetrahydromethanopterin reductase-like flavin-dependent oxidoreductase (luciferase family)
MGRTKRLRLGFFTYLEGDRPAAEVYRDVLELFEAADHFGFDVGWVAQHHFGHHGGLPSPFVFLAAAAERVASLGLGTAIVPISLDNPIRVAEDAAVLETLYPGRLELGVGTGFASDAVMATFDRAGGERRVLYDRALDRLIAALDGQPVNDDQDRLHPPAPALRERIWESPGSIPRVTEAARRGSGLLLSRIAIGGGDRPTPEIQVPLVETYLAELPVGTAPRIGFSRTVYPSRRPEIAFRDLSTGLEAMERATGQVGNGRSIEETFRHHNIHHGTPEAVIESLQREPLIDEITDLICQVQPGLPSQAQTLDAIELIATVVAPALGWQPANREAAAV